MARGKGSKRSKSKRAKSASNESVKSEGQYYVEAILDWGLHDTGVCMYLLKWENYPHDDNSWEFEQHVSDCDQLKAEFHANTVNGRHPPKYSWEEFDNFCQYLRHVCDDAYADVAVLANLSKHNAHQLVKSPKLIDQIKAEIESECDSLVKQFKQNRNNTKRIEARQLLNRAMKRLNIDSNFENITEFFEFIDNRKTIDTDLEYFTNKWNSVIKKDKGSLVVSLANEVDVEKPKYFDYITKYKYDVNLAKDIKLIDEPFIGCECTDCYDERDECCCSVVGFPMAYNRKGLLSSSRFSEISFECNSLCKCSEKCANRGTQRATNLKLQVFRTNNGERGWGVRSLNAIPRGSFVCDYVGEIISLFEADNRPTTYLFDLGSHLDTSDVEFTYVIDASKYGNVSRFINHSCEPNCRVLFVWSNNYDKHLPAIALFAIKPIRAFEELTYDYGMEVIDLYDDLKIGDDGVSNDGLSTDSGINESVNYSQISPFGAEISVSDKKSANLVKGNSKISKSNQSQERRGISFAKIDCLCGSSKCRKILFS